MLKIGESSADKYITTVFYITGLWFHATPSLPYRIHSFVSLFVVMLSWVACLDIGLILMDNLVEATHALCASIPVTVFFAKAMSLYVNNEKIQSCLARVHNFRLMDAEEKEFADNTLRVFFKFTVFYVVICNLTITFVCWHVMLLKEPELPFTAWYPLDWQHNNRDFWIAQSIQFYGMLIVVNVNLTCELFPCFFLTMIACQLKILGMRLQSLNSKRSIEGKKNTKIIEKLIDENVQTHYYIMSLTDDVQYCYNFPFFVEMCTAGLVVTFNTFHLAFLTARSKSGDHDIVKYGQYGTYLICAVVRIFLPCYFGNITLSASEALPMRLYSSGWLDMSVLCRKKVVTLMERMKRPTVIWAWILFPLTLEMFQSILNFSYTVLTMLQNFN